ncbi:MAG: hypothetical protein IMZ55_03315, partial [Acidobacteria bacterium]|nr:hypothetical protein [Acidobacteriota bacterium]
RRTASFEMDRDGLTILGRVAVRLEREATAAAVAMSETARPERADELPPSAPGNGRGVSRPEKEVWVEVGYDDALARELLAAVAEEIRKAEGGEALPPGQSPKDAAEETRRIGAQQGS